MQFAPVLFAVFIELQTLQMEIDFNVCKSLLNFTFAFFLICFKSGCTPCGLTPANGPWEYFFIGGRWNARNLIGPICVGMNGARNSTTGVEC